VKLRRGLGFGSGETALRHRVWVSNWKGLGFIIIFLERSRRVPKYYILKNNKKTHMSISSSERTKSIRSRISNK